MSDIFQNHFLLYKEDFLQHRKEVEGLSIKSVELTSEFVLNRVEKIQWGWINKKIYFPEVLEERIKNPQMKLFDLYDGEQNVGYVLISPPAHPYDVKGAVNDNSVIEIENIALYPSQEGKGRGWAFISLIMDEIYKTYDTVYLSQSHTNYPTLKAFYLRHGMTFLGIDSYPDFNPPQRQKIA